MIKIKAWKNRTGNEKNKYRKVAFSEIHYQAMQLYIQNKTYKQICEETGMKYENFRKLALTNDWKKEVEKLRTCARQNAKRRILGMANDALDVIQEGLNGDVKNQINIKCAEIILKAAGLFEPQDINVTGEINHVAMSLEQKKQLLLEKISNETLGEDDEDDFIDLNDDEYEIDGEENVND